MALVQSDISVCGSIKHWTCAALPRQRIVRVGQVDLRAVEVSNACCSGKEFISVYESALFIVLATWSVLASVVRLKADFFVHGKVYLTIHVHVLNEVLLFLARGSIHCGVVHLIWEHQ